MILDSKDYTLTPIIGLDIETNGRYAWVNNILAISISNSNGKTYVWEVRNHPKEFFIELFERISNECELVIGQNIKFDISFIWYHYNVLLTKLYDTLLASQLLYSGKEDVTHDLASIINRFLKSNLIVTEEKKYYQKSFIGHSPRVPLTEKQLQYAGDDTKYLIKVREAQLKKIAEYKLEKILLMENTLIPVLTKMEVTGCRIDVGNWRKTIKHDWANRRNDYERLLDEELQKLSGVFPQLKGRYTRERKKETLLVLDLFGSHKEISNENLGNINYSSSAQILEVFSLLNQPIPSIKTEEGFRQSADEGVLQTYLTEYPRSPLREFIKLLLNFRGINKLISTYGDKFLAKIDNHSKIHTEYSQCFVATGRLASRGPNLQNLPPSILNFFIPDNLDEVFIDCDMNSAEVRIAADYSREPKLIDSQIKGEDLHSTLASVSYSIIAGNPITIINADDLVELGEGLSFKSSSLRQAHKSVLFAKFYKGGKQRVYEILAEYINLLANDPMGTADRISKAIDKELPVLSKYLSGLIKEANKNLILRANKLGRIRHFTQDAYGDAANFPIQGTNADAMKIALINADRWLTKTGYGRCVLTVHDSLISSVKRQHTEECEYEIKNIMANALGYFLDVVPGGASVKTTECWKK